MKTDSIPVGSGISQLGHKLSEFLKATNIKHQNNPAQRRNVQVQRCSVRKIHYNQSINQSINRGCLSSRATLRLMMVNQ